MRIAQRLRPRYLLLENVSALLVRGMDTVLRELAEIGFNAEWHCIPAASVGAPHRRDRVFIIGYSDSNNASTFREVQGGEGAESSRDGGYGNVAYAIGESTGMEEHRGGGQRRESSRTSKSEMVRQEDGSGSSKRIGTSGQDVADAASGRPQRQRESAVSIGQTAKGKRQAIISFNGRVRDFWATEPDVGRVANGVPRRVDRLRCLGNAVVPQVAQFVGETILKIDQELNQ